MSREKPLVLVVDDQATAIRVMNIMLQPEYDVCVATSGEKGIEVARSQLPDLILLDKMMPGMSGVETCKVLKADPITQTIPIIFLTSMDDAHNESVGFNAGAVDYIYKPPAPESVKSRIRVHLVTTTQRKFIEKLAAGTLSDPGEIRETARQLLL